jgi:hypothetical protein
VEERETESTMIDRPGHHLSNKPTGASELARDEGGAIVVMGIFMATTLVACIWYVVGIGEAAVYRERMQDAADATAFVSAVYHARGMNMIAMINIIMASFMAVLIALKILYIIVLVVDMIATALCGVGFVPACAVPPPAKTIENAIQQAIPKVEKTVHKILPAMSTAERALAIIAPWAGSFVSITHASSYAPTVMMGGAVSVSMVPGAAIGSERIGLPVEELPFSAFCGKAGTAVTNFVFMWTPEIWQTISGVMMDLITSSFPIYFCGGGPDPNVELNAITQGLAVCNYIYPPVPPNNPMSILCKGLVLKEASGLGEKESDKYGEEKENTPKTFYEEAQAGDDYFMVYSMVLGDTARPLSADSGVKLASLGGGGASEADRFSETVGFARAEFYYDGTGGWILYSVDSLWKMRWRARLRRFRLPTPDIGQPILQKGIPDGVPGVPTKYKGKGLEKLNPFSDAGIGGRIVRAVSAQPDVWIDEQVGGMTDDYIVH